MNARSFLAARSLSRTQVRGKALEHWKRPNMDEYLGVKEPYAQAKSKQMAGDMLWLGAGVGALFAALAFGFSQGDMKGAIHPRDIGKANYPGYDVLERKRKPAEE